MSHFPSGLKTRLRSLVDKKAVVSAIFTSGPAAAGAIMTANRPVPSSRRKAIRRPSGDHAGLKSGAGSVVSRVGESEPFAFR